MDKFIINGGKRLEGEITISGSKNAALPLVIASILSDEISVIKNVPNLADIRSMILILEVLGTDARLEGSTLNIDPIKCDKYEAPYDLVRKMRASVYALGALLGRCGKARVSFPGGCVIGPRPIDLHLMGLEKLGAKIEIEHGYIIASADKLVGADMLLRGPNGPSVGATVNVMMAAVKAEGVTTIREASCEPQIIELAGFLKDMGAQIEGEGTPLMKIQGVKELHGANHSVIPDRIEAATYMIAAVSTRGNVLIKKAKASLMESVIDKLREIGANIAEGSDGIRISAENPLKPVDVRTSPYPGFPTDVQSQIMALMTTVEGISVITETVHPERFMHVSELNRMGADIKIEGQSAVVKGVDYLSGAPVMASELRGGAGLVIAGLGADNQTVISRIYHVDRGYEHMEQKLAGAGADIVRVSE
ncbi:UDP-N-acetylglucosamine 1-carboxyvinyltransferase [Candidatus Poribacteria bacterium]|nr:UDP-N-acetylglucosamine 1-carboxyvinyltransferase [Candidatus Poribacteria bacterium]